MIGILSKPSRVSLNNFNYIFNYNLIIVCLIYIATSVLMLLLRMELWVQFRTVLGQAMLLALHAFVWQYHCIDIYMTFHDVNNNVKSLLNGFLFWYKRPVEGPRSFPYGDLKFEFVAISTQVRTLHGTYLDILLLDRYRLLLDKLTPSSTLFIKNSRANPAQTIIIIIKKSGEM